MLFLFRMVVVVIIICVSCWNLCSVFVWLLVSRRNPWKLLEANSSVRYHVPGTAPFTSLSSSTWSYVPRLFTAAFTVYLVLFYGTTSIFFTYEEVVTYSTTTCTSSTSSLAMYHTGTVLAYKRESSYRACTQISFHL